MNIAGLLLFDFQRLTYCCRHSICFHKQIFLKNLFEWICCVAPKLILQRTIYPLQTQQDCQPSVELYMILLMSGCLICVLHRAAACSGCYSIKREGAGVTSEDIVSVVSGLSSFVFLSSFCISFSIELGYHMKNRPL